MTHPRNLLDAVFALCTLSLIPYSLAQAQPSAPQTASPPQRDTLSFAPAFRFTGLDLEDFSLGFELTGTILADAEVTSRLTVGPNPEDQLVGAALSYEQPLAPLLTSDPLTLRVVASSDFTQGHPLALAQGRTYTERLTQVEVGLEQPLSIFSVGLRGRVIGSEASLEVEEDDVEGDVTEDALLPNDLSGLLEVTFRYEGVEPGTPSSGIAAELAQIGRASCRER